MPAPRFAFCGNRFHVLEAMLEAGLELASIAAMAGSHAQKTLQERSIPHVTISDKQGFLHWLAALDCDVMIANGCPYIVPVADYPAIRFINIHPSYLPDLRGADPVPAAILFARDAGASCHVMDSGIDTGDIIAQERIAYDANRDVITLYKLCFEAETRVFNQALARGFTAQKPQILRGNEIYYSFKPADLQIDFSHDAQAIKRRVLAFCNPNKLARFTWKNTVICIVAADILDEHSSAAQNEIVAADAHSITIKKGVSLLRLRGFDEAIGALAIGDVLV